MSISWVRFLPFGSLAAWTTIFSMNSCKIHGVNSGISVYRSTKGRYDLVYKSRVFTDTYSKDTITVTNAEQVILGGTGYGIDNRLPPEAEHSYPDYAIYPQFFGIAYGFLSRGCPRNCGFCIVSGKEGRKSVKVADLSEFWKWQPEIKLMDANLLACPDHES